MSPGIVHCALLTSLCVCAVVTEVLLEIKSAVGDDCTLLCMAEQKPGVQYQAVHWCKEGEHPSSQPRCLLTRVLPDGVTQRYAGVEQQVELQGETRHIHLPKVTCGDSGLYTCRLAAPEGEQHREGQTLLTVTDCPNSSDLTDTYIIIAAVGILVFALSLFLMSCIALKNILGRREKMSKQNIFLDAPLKPLEKKDLMLIYTLGPKWTKIPSIKQICV